MAKNKQKAVPLDQAWQEYWAFLFQNDGDWKSSLERVILNRVVLLEFGAPAIGNMNAQQDLPTWAHGLSISLNGQMISLNIDGLQPLNCPLFVDSLTEENPRWKNRHPIKETVELPPHSRQLQKLWTGDCQKTLNRATIGVGKAIRQAFSAAIRDGKFIVQGKPSDAPFDELKVVPQSAFTDLFKLNLFDNTITFGTGDAKISTVSLYPVAVSTADQPRSNSFKETDLILVEEMKQLINRKEASSILDATNQVFSKAEKRKNSTKASVIDRLRRRFGGNYPNYMKQKSK